MAITMDGLNKAEITYCYELREARMADGSFAQIEQVLPWCFVRVADGGEERRLVATCSNGSAGLHDIAARPYRERKEYMRNKPFPHELDRARRSNGPGEDNVAGPIAVHFFGGI